MSAVASFCASCGIPNDWFFIVAELVTQRRFCSPELLAESVFLLHAGNYIYFGAEKVVVTPTVENDWVSVIHARVAGGFAVIAGDKEVSELIKRYRNEPSANTSFREPSVGDVMLTDIGYHCWMNFLDSPSMRNKPRWRVCIDRDGYYMYVGPTQSELESLCPLLSDEEESDERLRSLCSRFKTIADCIHCQIEHIGPYWDDNYFRYPDGYAIRCLQKRAGDDDQGRGVFQFTDIT